MHHLIHYLVILLPNIIPYWRIIEAHSLKLVLIQVCTIVFKAYVTISSRDLYNFKHNLE